MKNTGFKPKSGNPFKKDKKGTIKTDKSIDVEINYRSEKPDIESDSEDEMKYIGAKFHEMVSKEKAYFKDVTDGRYYFSVYFADNEQMMDFVNKTGINELFDDTGMFVAGKELAEKLSIPIIQKNLKKQGIFKQGKKFDIHNY